MSELFKVIPLRPGADNVAKVIQALANRPDFIAKVEQAVNEFAKRVILPEILLGKQFDQYEVRQIQDDVIKDVLNEDQSDHPRVS